MSSPFILLAALALHLFSPSLTTKIILPMNNSGSFLSMCHASPCLWNRIPASLHQNHPVSHSLYLASSCTCQALTAFFTVSPLLAPITTSLFHSRIKTYLFTNPFHCRLSVLSEEWGLSPYTWIISSAFVFSSYGMGMCCEKKTLIGWRNVWNMRWRAPDQEVDQRGHGKGLCKKIAKHVIWTRRMLWIMVDGRSW